MSKIEANNFPARLKVAALFTAHRKRFLLAHNLHWFHSGYAPVPEGEVEDESQDPTEINSEDDLTLVASDSLEISTVPSIEASVLEQEMQVWDQEHSSVLQSVSAYMPQNSIEAQDKTQETILDPLHFEPQQSPSIQMDELEMDGDQAVVWYEPEPGIDSASSSSDPVQLFPFPDSSLSDLSELEESPHYDLNVFDNGELEDPPVAKRNKKLSTFESVPYDADRHGEAYHPLKDESLEFDVSASPQEEETLPSAEIAKSRLKKCL